MPRNGSGTYSLPAGNPVVTGTTISSTVQNNTTSDIATALTNSLAKDGQTTPTANLPMGSFKLTGLAAGTTAGDSLRYEQLVGAYLPLAGGTVTGATTFSALLTTTLGISSAAGISATTGAYSGDVTVADEAYDATAWNANLEVPTKNALRDKIVTMDASIATVTPWVTGPIFAARNSTAQTVVSAAPTKVTLGTEIYDTNTNFASDRFTPTVAGYYQINGIIRGAATSMTNVNVVLYVNGSAYRQGGTINLASATTSQHVVVSDVILFNGSTDYVELWGSVTGTNPAFDYVSSSIGCEFSGHFIRPT
jgi:hypothetical protein